MVGLIAGMAVIISGVYAILSVKAEFYATWIYLYLFLKNLVLSGILSVFIESILFSLYWHMHIRFKEGDI